MQESLGNEGIQDVKSSGSGEDVGGILEAEADRHGSLGVSGYKPDAQGMDHLAGELPDSSVMQRSELPGTAR